VTKFLCRDCQHSQPNPRQGNPTATSKWNNHRCVNCTSQTTAKPFVTCPRSVNCLSLQGDTLTILTTPPLLRSSPDFSYPSFSFPIPQYNLYIIVSKQQNPATMPPSSKRSQRARRETINSNVDIPDSSPSRPAKRRKKVCRHKPRHCRMILTDNKGRRPP
jgi:hypothetical protein